MNALRWSARISGLLLAIVVGAFLAGQTAWLEQPDTVEAAQLAFFLVMAAGWLVGWVRERIGGAMTMIGWVGFEAIEWAKTGAPVLAPQFLVMLVPGLLFLVAAAARGEPRAQDPAT